MNGLNRKRIEKNIQRLTEHIINDSQDLIEDVLCNETGKNVKNTLHDLFEGMILDEMDDGAPAMSDEYENEVRWVIEKAIVDNDKKINNMIKFARQG